MLDLIKAYFANAKHYRRISKLQAIYRDNPNVLVLPIKSINPYKFYKGWAEEQVWVKAAKKAKENCLAKQIMYNYNRRFLRDANNYYLQITMKTRN